MESEKNKMKKKDDDVVINDLYELIKYFLRYDKRRIANKNKISYEKSLTDKQNAELLSLVEKDESLEAIRNFGRFVLEDTSKNQNRLAFQYKKMLGKIRFLSNYKEEIGEKFDKDKILNLIDQLIYRFNDNSIKENVLNFKTEHKDIVLECLFIYLLIEGLKRDEKMFNEIFDAFIRINTDNKEGKHDYQIFAKILKGKQKQDILLLIKKFMTNNNKIVDGLNEEVNKCRQEISDLKNVKKQYEDKFCKLNEHNNKLEKKISELESNYENIKIQFDKFKFNNRTSFSRKSGYVVEMLEGCLAALDSKNPSLDVVKDHCERVISELNKYNESLRQEN